MPTIFFEKYDAINIATPFIWCACRDALEYSSVYSSFDKFFSKMLSYSDNQLTKISFLLLAIVS